MNALCLYAIVRFMPFVETEEFANVGVVLYSPSRRYFGFRVLTHDCARITRFFEHVDGPAFGRTMVDLQGELDRVAGSFPTLDAGAGAALWGGVIQPKSEPNLVIAPRAGLGGGPLGKPPELYGRYVERDLATPEAREQILS